MKLFENICKIQNNCVSLHKNSGIEKAKNNYKKHQNLFF